MNGRFTQSVYNGGGKRFGKNKSYDCSLLAINEGYFHG